MRTYAFLVIFSRGADIIVHAFNEFEAKILAQAEKIQAALCYEVIDCYKVD